jgi:hypothetical protein
VNVLLLRFDGKMPNLALMKLAAWHRAAGDRVVLRNAGNMKSLEPELGDPGWGRVYGSMIFESSKPLGRRAQQLYPGVWIGGTGWDFDGGAMTQANQLPPELKTSVDSTDEASCDHDRDDAAAEPARDATQEESEGAFDP